MKAFGEGFWELPSSVLELKRLLAVVLSTTTAVDRDGEVAEWLKAPVSKTGISGNRDRGFESRPLRHDIPQSVGSNLLLTRRGEVPERLNGHAWKACVGQNPPQVRILSSPPFRFSGFRHPYFVNCDPCGSVYRD